MARVHPDINGKRYQVSIYIKHDLIDSYRRRKQFREHIELLKNSDPDDITCYFVGAYPVLSERDGKFGNFKSLEVSIKNLDHLVLRHHKGGEE